MLVAANIYSIFQPLTDVFESVLKFFHSAGIGWGLSIVLLTVCVRAVLIPLTLRQMKSMVRMQAFAPQMKEIQAKYKEDKQRQQQEIMKFYKENDLHPLGSCLPMILQLPAFFALYAMLRESLRGDICPQIQKMHNHGVLSNSHTVPCGDHGASFLFIHDLTDKATGISLIVLLILYVGSQLSSSVLMSSAAMEKSQRQIMMFMPLIFVAFIFRFPAGLLVYWITTNLWTVGQQYIIKRRMGAHQVAIAAAGGPAVGAATPPGEKNAGSGDGIGAMLRKRLEAGRESAGAGTADTGSSGGGRARAASEGSGSSRGGGGNGGGSTAKAKTTGSGHATRTKAPRAERAKSGSGSGGSGNGAGGSANGSGNGSGATSGSGAAPPRPPRKKKKRSGRRR